MARPHARLARRDRPMRRTTPALLPSPQEPIENLVLAQSRDDRQSLAIFEHRAAAHTRRTGDSLQVVQVITLRHPKLATSPWEPAKHSPPTPRLQRVVGSRPPRTLIVIGWRSGRPCPSGAHLPQRPDTVRLPAPVRLTAAPAETGSPADRRTSARCLASAKPPQNGNGAVNVHSWRSPPRFSAALPQAWNCA